MTQFVIERGIRGVGGSTAEELKAISQKSVSVLDDLGGDVRWLHSYVTDDKIYCVYEAPDADRVREHARRGGFPADSVQPVSATISPATAGA